MATVSARIPDELKDLAEQEEINISRVIRESINKEIKKKRRKKLSKEAKDLSKEIKDLDTESVVKSVRESRQER